MIKKTFKTFTKFSAYWLASALFALGLWINLKFGDPSFEQVIYHFQFGGEALLSTDTNLLLNFVEYCVLLPFVLALILYHIERIVLLIKDTAVKRLVSRSLGYLTSFLLNTQHFVFGLFKKRLPLFLLIFGAAFLLTKVSFWTYLQGLKYENFVDQNYVKPINVKPPILKKNLILIYVESLETTYSNENLFERNLLKTLDHETNQWASVKNFQQVSGTGWTIAGIVSSQCGIPLRPYTWFDKDEPDNQIDGNKLGEKANYFMPGAICMGDLLKNAGYKNVFLGGASKAFAGKGKFFSNHGYDEIYGREDWMALGEKSFNGWGLYDDRLFHHAKLKLDELQQANKPFNLTLLTLDTHPPGGHASAYCNNYGVRDLLGIYECTADIVANFIQYIKIKGYDKNTNIVIIGDHLSMVNNHYDQLTQEKNRTIYNKFYALKPLIPNRDTMYHFSVFPSIMYMLGFDFAKNRLALGASIFGELDSQFKLHADGDINTKLNAKSEIYKKIWSY